MDIIINLAKIRQGRESKINHILQMITKDTFSLKGKKIIITGVSSGIGRQCAVSCSQKGATIVLIGRDKVRLDEQ